MKSLVIRLLILVIIFSVFFARMPLHPGISHLMRVALPKTLIISSIGVKAQVEYVGLDTYGGMDVPKHGRDVAWYTKGARPGESGNAVIDGHVDFVDGKPAVFAKIAALKNGDEIDVLDAEKKTHRYRVIDNETYDENHLPLQKIFGKTTDSYLNLITCAGDFSEDTQEYSKRVVVYSQLVSSE